MTQSRLLRALAIASLMVAGVATAQAVVPCTTTTVVEATGYWSDSDGAGAIDAAVAAALSTAIASVRGVTVTDESTLVERFRTEYRDGELTSERSSDLTTNITARLAGSVVDFHVVETLPADVHGIMGVRLHATVCLDPRLAISLSGRGAGVDPDLIVRSLLANVAPQARGLGWSLVPERLDDVFDSSDALAEVVVTTGATAVLRGAVVGQILEQSERLVSYELVISFTLSDVTSGVVLVSDAILSARGVGYSVAGAVTAAMESLSAELGRAVTRALVPSHMVPVAYFEFAPIRRAGSRHTIVDRVRTMPGVIDIDHASLNGDTLTIAARVTGDPCEVSRRLTDWTRIRLTVEQCSSAGAWLRVLRE